MDKADRFVRLTLHLDPVLPAREIAVAWLNGCGFSMFEEVETGVIAYAREPEWREPEMNEILASIAEMAKSEASTEFVEGQNWNAQWEAEYEPIDVDGLIRMRAPFHPAPEQGVDVIIQPEMSFGTGHHPTTWQMMRTLVDLDLEGKSVLDIGCGTGALAIAAKKLGAGHVVAFDVDEWSYDNTLANCERNGVHNAIEVYHGTIESLTVDLGEFDVLLANINLNVLLAEMKHYVRYLKPGGHIAFSGFFTTDVSAIAQCAHGQDLRPVSHSSREDWACALFVKRAAIA
jgi:ribosomal protein L11 methyltransferase